MGCVSILCTDPVAGKSFIVLRPDDVELEHFLETVVQDTCQSSSFERLPLNHETVHTLFNSMDSERDRRVRRVLLGANRSTKELFQQGIDSMKNMSNLIEQVTTVAKEVENAKLAAEDLLILHYKDMLKQIESKVEKNEKRLSVKEKEWSESQVMHLEDPIDMLKVKQDDMNNLLQQSTPYDVQRFQGMRKRRADSLIEEYRLKRRKTGKQDDLSSLMRKLRSLCSKPLKKRLLIMDVAEKRPCLLIKGVLK